MEEEIIENKGPLSRIDLQSNFTDLINNVSTNYPISQIQNAIPITTGYEDCNVKIETPDNNYLLKIFASDRPQEDIDRYVEIMRKVVDAGINHPTLIQTKDKIDFNRYNNLDMVLMAFIPGETFLELGRTPNGQELQEIIHQTTKINSLAYHPPYAFDTWAVPNILNLYNQVKPYIAHEDLPLIQPVIDQYSQLQLPLLPNAFVHGDLTKANILKSNSGEIYILDFSVSNWYPRIQEIAVMTANLMHEEDYVKINTRLEKILPIYEKYINLTQIEKDSLYTYTLAATAMEFLGAHFEKYIHKNDTEETNFWLNLGRSGLRKELLT